MKKFIFTLAIAMMVCGSGNLFAQSTDKLAEVMAFAQQRFQKSDERDYEPISAIQTDLYEKKYEVTYSYYENTCYLREEKVQKETQNGWENVKRISYEYDMMGNVLQSLEDVWEADDWVSQTKQTYTYDQEGKLDEWLVQEWNNGAWKNSIKQNYIYDDNVTTILNSSWNQGVWETNLRYVITYSQGGYEFVQQKALMDGTWENVYKKIVSYNADYNVSEEIYQLWVNEDWTNKLKDEYNYEGLLCVSIFCVDWNGSDWNEPDSKVEFAYDDNGNATRAMGYNYCYGEWQEYGYCTDITMPYAYNAKSKTFSQVTSVTIVYEEILSTNEMTENNAFNLYPNPANGMINVNGEGFEKAEIYNIAGQKVMESSNAQIDVKALQAGVYMVKVFGNGSSEMLRVVVK